MLKPIVDKEAIQIEITNACIYRCANCTRLVGHHKKPYMMDLDYFKVAVDNIAKTPTLIGIMGRTAAYTGKEVTWDEMLNSNERLGPTEYAMGPVPIKAEIPVPGNAENVAKHART